MANLWTWLREQWTYAGIVNAHRAGGSPDAVSAANREVFFRAQYLEEFRDYASVRYLQGFDLASSAAEFIKKRLSAKTTALSTADTAMIRAVIRDMREEDAFHPEALTKYRAAMESALAGINAEAKRLYGSDAHSPLVTRVLRGRS